MKKTEKIRKLLSYKTNKKGLYVAYIMMYNVLISYFFCKNTQKKLFS